MCGYIWRKLRPPPDSILLFILFYIRKKKKKVEHVTRVIVLIFKQNKAILNFSIFYKIK